MADKRDTDNGRPSSTGATNYGPGVHGDDWPDNTLPIDRRDEFRRFEPDGLRRWYFRDGEEGGGLYGKDYFDQTNLAKIRRDLLSPKVVSK